MSKVAWLGLLWLRVYKRFVFLVTFQGFVHSRDCTHSVLVDGLGGLVHSTKVWINQPAHTLLRFLKSNLRSSSTSVATARNRSILHSVKTQPLLHQFTIWTSDWICEQISGHCSSLFYRKVNILKTKQLFLVAQCGKWTTKCEFIMSVFVLCYENSQ